MSVYLITIQNRRKVARAVTCAADYRQLRNSAANQNNLYAARKGNEAAKRRLVQFNYSGHYPDGFVKGHKLPSKAFGFDVDDPEEFRQVSQRLLEDPDRYGLLMMERSARQGGHCVFRRQQGKTILENQCRIAALLGCEMDTSAHDINRVYFSTTALPEDLLYLSDELFADKYDEQEVAQEAQILEDRERAGREELPEGAHKANKHFSIRNEELGIRNCSSMRNEEVASMRNEELGMRNCSSMRNEEVASMRNEELGIRNCSSMRNEEVASMRNEEVASMRNEELGIRN